MSEADIRSVLEGSKVNLNKVIKESMIQLGRKIININYWKIKSVI